GVQGVPDGPGRAADREPGALRAVGSAAALAPASRAAAAAPRQTSAPPPGELIEEVAVAFDVRGEVERVLARQPLGELGVAPLECFDDLQVIDDRACRASVLRDGSPADRAHVQEQVLGRLREDRKSTRLNSSHRTISYAVFCLKKKKKEKINNQEVKKR